jgi:hypothetical protein
MSIIRIGEKGLVEKNLLALPGGHSVFFHILIEIT